MGFMVVFVDININKLNTRWLFRMKMIENKQNETKSIDNTKMKPYT